jgi:hypothetical protein
MSVRKCDFDQLQAKYACTTHSAYFCKKHYKQHIADGDSHSSVKIDSALTQLEFEKLKNELNKRISALEKTKKLVASKAAQLIADIEQASISSIQIIDHQIQAYQVYRVDNNFDHKSLKTVSKILASTLEGEIDQQLSLNIRELPIGDEKVKQLSKQIPSKKDLVNSASREEKIAYCHQLQLADFKKKFLDDGYVKIQEIFFSNDQSAVFICKS